MGTKKMNDWLRGYFNRQCLSRWDYSDSQWYIFYKYYLDHSWSYKSVMRHIYHLNVWMKYVLIKMQRKGDIYIECLLQFKRILPTCIFHGYIVTLPDAHFFHWRHDNNTLQWRHDECDGVSNHLPHDCLLNRLSRRRSKKHQASASLAFVTGIHRWPVNSPYKGPVPRKMFPFDDVIMHGSVYCTDSLVGRLWTSTALWI